MSRLILIAGGSCSGKTTLAEKLAEWLGDRAIVCHQDDYYKDLGHLSESQMAEYNFDLPDAIDEERMLADIRAMLSHRAGETPLHNCRTHRRDMLTETKPAAEFVVFEGMFALHYPELVEKALARIFVHCDENIRINRRIRRDTSERGLTRPDAMSRYLNMAAPVHEELVEPTTMCADLVVSGGGESNTALAAMKDYLKDKLRFTARAVESGCRIPARP